MAQLRGIAIAAAALFCAVVPAMAQTAPPLGLVQQFGALGGAGVTGSTGLGTTINGDVGSSPTPTITNFPPSKTVPPFIVHLANDAFVQQAHLDAITAYNNLFNQGTGAGATLLGPQLSGVILGPGVYRFAVAADLAASGVLTLNDPSAGKTGIFIFSVGSSLTENVLSSVVGTANPCNVYWQVGTSATLNGNNFFGTVIADQSVAVASSNNLTGRVVGVNAAVTMPGAGGNTIGGCNVAGLAGPPPSGPAGGPTLDAVGMSILLVLLAAAGVFAVNRFTT